jgi:4-carboxymuconolactone decarboxylase
MSAEPRQDEPLDAGLTALIRLSGAAATADARRLSAALERTRSSADVVEVEEAILQLHLFLGYPVALNALALWRELQPHREVEPPVEGSVPAMPLSRDELRERGDAVCRVVYGAQFEGLRANVRRLHPDLDDWMLLDGYGRVLARPGLALWKRELCIVAVLAGLDVPRQLYSHLRGSLNAGASPTQVRETLHVALNEWAEADLAGVAHRRDVAEATLAKVLERPRTEEESMRPRSGEADASPPFSL